LLSGLGESDAPALAAAPDLCRPRRHRRDRGAGCRAELGWPEARNGEPARRGRCRESERLRRAALEAALDGFISIDGEGRIVEFNPAAERTFGHRPADAIGVRMVELIVPPKLRAAHARGCVNRHPWLGSIIAMTTRTTGPRRWSFRLPCGLGLLTLLVTH
jgi:PAS domain S-box-containing protein